MTLTTVGTGHVGPGPDSAAPTGSSRLGKDEFVKLLMAQLANQDPTSPQDSAAFVAQLAQFASVELQQHQAGQLEALLVAQAANNQTAVTNLVGKEVLFRSDAVTLTGGAASSLSIDVDRPVSQVTITIEDEQGRVVRRQTLGAQSGEFTFTWDGLDDSGQPAPDGAYRVKVVASDEAGASVDAVVSQVGRVDGVSFAQGYPVLLVGDIEVRLPDVVEVHAPDPEPDVAP